jgi:hypothetical protein
MTHFGVYGIMLLISAAVVVYAAATGYTGYFNALFKIFDEQ